MAARVKSRLRGLGERKGKRFLIGFAAETRTLVESARRKLLEKNLDLIVANDVGRDGSGFGSESNAAVLLDREGGRVEVPLVGKRELAERIWDRVQELRGRRQVREPQRRGEKRTAEARRRTRRRS